MKLLRINLHRDKGNSNNIALHKQEVFGSGNNSLLTRTLMEDR